MFKIIFFLIPLVTFAEPCFYKDTSGSTKQVSNINQVPAKFKKNAICGTPVNEFLANPEHIELSGTVREQEISTELGRMQLRWPRKVESLFGRTPERAVADVARTVARVVNLAGFPAKLRDLKVPWKIVFMDEDVPETQIPTYLISNCHPAWMTPPGNIYVVSQRVAGGCGAEVSRPSGVNDAMLAEVLLHEMGHALEFQLLSERQSPRVQAEGFAAWFEQFAAEYSSIIPKGSVAKSKLEHAKISLKQQPDNFVFNGSPYDYARSAQYFNVIVKRSNVLGLMDIYKLQDTKGINFYQAVEESLGWSQKKLEQEVKDSLN